MIGPIIVILLVGGKLADAATLYVQMARHAKQASANALCRRRPDDRRETPESYVFAVLQRRLSLLMEQKRRIAEQATLKMFGLFWRTPVFLGVTTLILAPTTPHANDVLVLIAAVGCVAVAVNPVVTVLAAVGLRFDSEEVLAVGGLHPKRASDRSRKAEDASSPVVVLIGEAAAYLMSFSLLYHALSATEGPSAFHHHLDFWLSVYLGITTGATIGTGDIYATAAGGQIVVAVQLLATAAAITLYAALLLQMVTGKSERP